MTNECRHFDVARQGLLLIQARRRSTEKGLVPFDLAKQRYGGHFNIVANDLHETDDLRVLDYNGDRAFNTFNFSELGEAHIHEPLH
jgi:hypothetical protein